MGAARRRREITRTPPKTCHGPVLFNVDEAASKDAPMFRLIYRQRRRLILGAFFATLGLMMMALDKGALDLITDHPAWIAPVTIVLTALIVMACTVAVGAMVILLLPNWRYLLEMMGITIFVNAAFNTFLPSVFDIPVIGGFVPFILAMFVFALMYGEMLDRFRLWLDYRSVRSFVSPKSADALWAELVPGEAPVAAHWDSLLYSLEPDPEDPDTFQVQYNHGISFFEHQTMTFLEKDAPFHAKYHHVGEVNPNNRSLVEGTYEVRIIPRDSGGCKVTIRDCRDLMLHRAALAAWFDDTLGDQVDHLRARHKGRRDWSLTGRIRRKIGQLS
jgi:hypothetical protein